MGGDFQISGKMVGMFSCAQATHLYLYLIISLNSAEQSRLVGGASRVEIMGLCETRRVFLLLSYEEEEPVWCLGKYMEWQCLKVSL